MTLIGATPDEVNETITAESGVERMTDDTVKGRAPAVAVAKLLNIGGKLTENATSTCLSDASKVDTNTSLRATEAVAGVFRPVTEQRINAL